MKRLLAAVALVLMLLGCAEPVSGTVVAKAYIPSHDYSCQTGSVMVGSIPVPIWGTCTSAPDWRIKVKPEKGEPRWVSVSEEEYAHLAEGSFVTVS